MSGLDALAIARWLEVLDHLSYYEILNCDPRATPDHLRAAFYHFAATFHPDAHAARPPRERESISVIFKRGNEAYRVLSNAALRMRYDEALLRGQVRPSQLLSMPPPADTLPPPSNREGRMRSPPARPFVLRAEELMKKGDPKQAKIQLVMAMHMDSNNPALEAFLKEIEAEVLRLANEERKKWQKNR